MSLRIIDNVLAIEVAKALVTVCPEPGISIDIVTGEIFIDGALSQPRAPGVRIVNELIESQAEVSIRGDLSTTPVVFHENRWVTLGERGGGFVLPNQNFATSVEVIIDATFCAGRGYFFPGPSGVDILGRLDISLFHELGHALQWIRGVAGDLESGALSAENEYRDSVGYPRRIGLGGSGACVSPDGGGMPPPTTSDFGRIECFVATAALGSPTHEDVIFLRRFRDDVLRRTRAGYDFFEAFYDEYYRLSPDIVAMMETRPELREMVRVALVAPLIHHLRTVVGLPTAPLDGVPEPWRSFLDDLVTRSSAWARSLPLRTDLTGLEPLDAAREVDAVLRFVLRTAPHREEYLSTLERGGHLPLRADAGSRARIVEFLRASGHPAEVISRVGNTGGDDDERSNGA